MEVLYNTDMLSPYTKVAPATAIPIIRNLYRNPLIYSVHCFMAMNSDPKELVDIWIGWIKYDS